MLVFNTLNAASRTFFRTTTKPVIKRYKQPDPSQYPWMERNLANLVTGFRIVCGLIVSYFLVVAYDTLWILFWFGLAIITIMSDGVDGEIARGLQTESTLGKALDPLADKILLASLSIGLVINFTRTFGDIPQYFFVAVMGALFLEISVLITGTQVGIKSRALGQPPIGSNIYGKVKFAIQCLAMVLGWTIPDRSTACLVATALLVVAMLFSLMSNRGYRRELYKLQKTQ